MGNTLIQEALRLDSEATLFINGLHTSWTDPVWQFLSSPIIWFLLFIPMVAYSFLRLGWKRGLITFIALLLTVGLCGQTANLVKLGFERLRPCWDEDLLEAGLRVLEGKGGDFGFFSAHAANAMGLAVCSFLCLRFDRRRQYRGYAWLAFILAFLIGISRIFVGKHYLGDVMAGFLVGLAAGWLFAFLARLVMKRLPLSGEET